MTVDELRQLQDREGLRERHVLELRDDGWTLAHTDHERALAGAGARPLDRCPVHRWTEEHRLPGPPGIYLLARVHGTTGYRLEELRVAV